MKLFNAFPHAQQLKAPLQLSCKRHLPLFRAVHTFMRTPRHLEASHRGREIFCGGCGARIGRTEARECPLGNKKGGTTRCLPFFMEALLHVPIYDCPPCSAWKNGSIEHHRYRLLRLSRPKSTKFSKLSPRAFSQVFPKRTRKSKSIDILHFRQGSITFVFVIGGSMMH